MAVFVNFIQEFNPGQPYFSGQKELTLLTANVAFLRQRSKPSLSSRSLYFFPSTFLVLYHWAVPSNYDDSDDDVVEKAPKQTSVIVAAGCLVVVVMVVHCKAMAQSYFNNQKLLADCETFQENQLEKAELFQTDMKRKIEDKLPSWKKQLDVLDIDVSLYASLLQPRVKSE